MNREKINVMHIRDSIGIYGAERVILTLGKNINRERYNFILLCMRRKDGRSEKLINRAQKCGIDVTPVNVNGKIDLGAIANMRKILKYNRISIIHTHDYKSDIYGLIASLNLGIKRVSTVHGSTRDSIKKKFYLFVTERFIHRYFNKLIAVSEDIYQYLGKFHHEPNRIEVVQNGIDFTLVSDEIQNEKAEDTFSFNKDQKIFAVIGRLFPDKGHRFFLEAFAEFSKDYPSTMAVIVGDGPNKDKIVKQLRKLNLIDRVRMCGVRADMKTVYDNIDFLLIPSLREGLPYVLLEAMAYKIPVLASAVGEIPHLIEDGVTGYLVRGGDVEGLVKKMKEMMDSPDKLKMMTGKAFSVVSERFSAERMVRNTEKIYSELTA